MHLGTVFSAIPPLKLNELFPLYCTNDLDLVCGWRTVNNYSNQSNVVRTGLHCIPGINLGISQAPLQLSSSKNKSLGRALFAQTVLTIKYQSNEQ